MRYEPQKGKKADKKLTHLSLMEPKTVGNSDSRDKERNGAGCMLQKRISLEAPRSFLNNDKDLTRVLGAD